MVADPGKAGGDQLALGEQFLAVAHSVSIGDEAAIAVGGDIGAPQHDVVAANERRARPWRRHPTLRQFQAAALRSRPSELRCRRQA
jgi:hypothetical protein